MDILITIKLVWTIHVHVHVPLGSFNNTLVSLESFVHSSAIQDGSEARQGPSDCLIF